MAIGRLLSEIELLRREILEKDNILAQRDALLIERENMIRLLQASNDDLARELQLLRDQISGRKNERDRRNPTPDTPPQTLPDVSPGVPVSDSLVEEADSEPSEAEMADSETEAEEKPERKKPRRRNLADATGIPSRALRVSRDPAARCSQCGGDFKDIGTAESWRLEWVPGHFERIQILREKCVCPKCPSQGVLTAPEPTFALPRALCGNGLLARILVDKFADHIPLNRQVRRIAREGAEIGSSVLASWVLAGADLLERVAQAIDERLMKQSWLQGDDTGFPVQDGIDGALRKGRMWAYTDQQEVRYHFSDTKEGKEPVKFLDSFQGAVLLVDCGSEFNEVVRKRKLKRAGCWAHLRRYFFEARAYHPEEVRLSLGTIRDLFLIERKIRELSVEERREVRRTQSEVLVNRLYAWWKKLSAEERPKSGLGTALHYALGHETEFRTFLEHPEIPMDNNLSELQLRQEVIGRKNWLFARSEGGAKAAATVYTLVGSCVLQGIDPWAYLVDVLRRLPDHAANRVEELTPMSWRIARED